MSLLFLYCFLRIRHWSRMLRRDVELEKIPHILKLNTRFSLVIMSVLGIDTAVTYLSGMFNATVLIPVSLSFSSAST